MNLEKECLNFQNIPFRCLLVVYVIRRRYNLALNALITLNITSFIFCQFLCRYEGEDVRLMLWDTAGQEEFDAITKAYYRGAQACVLAFSSTDRGSFEAIHSWKVKVCRRTSNVVSSLLSHILTGYIIVPSNRCS